PGRGVFEGVEWYRNMPCAKISMSIKIGAQELKEVRNLNSLPGDAQNVEVQEVVWLSIEKGVIVRQELNIRQEALVEVQSASPAGGGNVGGAAGAPGGQQGAAGRPNRPGANGPVGGGFHSPTGFGF